MPKKVDFKKLQEKWYKKLEKSGFHDIESDEDNLKVWSSIFAAKHTKEVLQAKISYYQMASSFLEEYKFSSNVDKIIWEYHTNGIGVRDIAATLNKTKILKTNRTDVWKIIKRLKHTMFDMYMAPKKEYYEG